MSYFPPCPRLLLTIDDCWLHSLNSRLSHCSTSPHHAFLRTTCIALCGLPPLTFSSLALYRLLPPSHFLFYGQVIFSLLHPSECLSFAHVSASSSWSMFSHLICSIPHLHPAPCHLAMFSRALPTSPLQPWAAFAPIVCHLLTYMPPATDIHTPESKPQQQQTCAHAHAQHMWGLWRSRFLWGFELVSPFFWFHFFFLVMCICTPSRHAPECHPCTPPPSPGQEMKHPRHRQVSTTTIMAYTHIACITHPCRFLCMACGQHATDHTLRPTKRLLVLHEANV